VITRRQFLQTFKLGEPHHVDFRLPAAISHRPAFFGLGRSAGVGDRLLLPVEGPEGQSGHHSDEGEGKGA
jgi:hypothetical protein